MRLALIAAMAENGVIGVNNKLPWYLPEDLKYFKSVTMGKPILMGHNTFKSIGKPLPGRTNIVISRDANLKISGCDVRHSLGDAIELAGQVADINGQSEAVVIGGAEIYSMALATASRLYLTRVHAEVEGNVFFPALDESQWREVASEMRLADGPNPYNYSFVVLERN